MEGGLAIAGVALAIPAVIESCFKYGNHIKELVQSYRDVPDRLDKLAMWVRVTWATIEIELKQVKAVLEVAKPPEEYRENLEWLMLELHSQLKAVSDKLDAVHDGEDVFERALFVLTGDAKITKMLAKLDKWQRLFHTHWKMVVTEQSVAYQISLRRTHSERGTVAFEDVKRVCKAIQDVADRTLPAELRIKEADLGTVRWVKVEPRTDLDIVIMADAPEPYAQCIFDPISEPWPSQVAIDHERTVHELTTLLSAVSTGDVGILACRGFVEATLGLGWKLIFELPPNTAPAPRSLRSLLTDEINAHGPKHPLNDRLRLATQLARAVFFVHTANLVHKGIRPESILMTEAIGTPNTARYPHALGTPYLVGFDKIRYDSSSSLRTGDKDVVRNLYRHPDRQGIVPTRDFEMADDIYSLGVCLLEIARWQSFVRWDERTQNFVLDDSVVDFRVQSKTPAVPPDLGVSKEKPVVHKSPTPSLTKDNSSKIRSLLRLSGTERHVVTTNPPAVVQAVDVPAVYAKKSLKPTAVRDKLLEEARMQVPLTMGQKFSEVVVRCLTCKEDGFGIQSPKGVNMGVKYIEHVLTALESISL